MRKHLLLAPLALLACSCATVVRGTSETAQFESTPSGAGVTAESISEDKMGPFNCVTPCELELKRKRTWKVDFELEGYKPVSGLLKPVVTGGGVAAGAGNVLIGGLIGVGIDAGTGANLDLRPNPMIAELEVLDSSEESRILDAEIVPADWKAEDAQDAEGDESAEPDAAPEEGVGEDAAEEAPPASPSEESAEEALPEAEEPEALSDLAPADDAMNETVSGVYAKNANVNAQDAAAPLIEASETVNMPDHAKPNFYKPGEPAPTDEEADALNQVQLKKLPAENNDQ